MCRPWCNGLKADRAIFFQTTKLYEHAFVTVPQRVAELQQVHRRICKIDRVRGRIRLPAPDQVRWRAVARPDAQRLGTVAVHIRQAVRCAQQQADILRRAIEIFRHVGPGYAESLPALDLRPLLTEWNRDRMEAPRGE